MNLSAIINANQKQLSEKEVKLINFLIENSERSSTLSISKLSQLTKVSTATISRLAKKLGFQNFQELRVLLAQEKGQANQLFKEIKQTDSVLDVGRVIFDSNIDALEETKELLNEDDLVQAINYIIHAKRVGFYGLGASNLVAQDGYHKFLRTPIKVNYVSDYHMQLMEATRLTSNDVMILISHSGTDQDAFKLGKTAVENGTPVILITANRQTPLEKIATITFQAVAKELEYRAEALHALLAELSLVDTLFVLTAIKTDKKSMEIHQAIKNVIQSRRL